MTHGATINSTGTVTTPFLFQGNYYDALTGLYRTPTRFYDPATGRWTQPSRDAYAPSQSRYEFELNNASSVP